jgi:two-component sensor histidine kinase
LAAEIDEQSTRHGAFRLVALVDVTAREKAQRVELEQRIREKDALLREIQHRVKNNLQMITAFIRLESRNATIGTAAAPLDRLAGRIGSVQLLYQSLSEDEQGSEEIDLGV